MTLLNIAFFVAEFPILSETFVIQQVAGLVRAGHKVTVIAGQWGDKACAHETYRQNQLGNCVLPVRVGIETTQAKTLNLCKFIVRSAFLKQGRKRLGVAMSAASDGSTASLLDIAAVSTKPVEQQHLGKYDAIIAHFGPAGVRAMHLQQAGLLEGPLAVVFHGSDMSDRATLARHMGSYRALFKHATKLLPISCLWQKRLIEWDAQPEKIEVLRMGVNIDRLSMLDPSRPLQTPLRVLSVARFTEKKGLQYAIEGIVAAKGAIRYDIIGSGPLEAELKTMAAKAPSDKQIVFLGKQSQQQVFEALEAADIFLLPSVTAAGGDMEGIPVALMEAMAKGVLTLATEHSGIPELITHQLTGLLVRERNSSDIEKQLDELREGKINLSYLRSEARKRIAEEFDNQKLDNQIQRVVQDLSLEKS